MLTSKGLKASCLSRLRGKVNKRMLTTLGGYLVIKRMMGYFTGTRQFKISPLTTNYSEEKKR